MVGQRQVVQELENRKLLSQWMNSLQASVGRAEQKPENFSHLPDFKPINTHSCGVQISSFLKKTNRESLYYRL